MFCERGFGHPCTKYARFPLGARFVPSDVESTVTPMPDIHYIECDVPPGQTLAQWRRERSADRHRAPSWLRRRRLALRALRRRLV
jgi:hypothetical protein